MLGAGMLGVISDSGDVLAMPHIAVDDYNPLVTGQLVFRSMLAADVIADLNRAYGVEIQLTDTSLSTHKLTMTVSTKWSVEEMLTVVTKTLNAHYTRAGRVITISPGLVAPRIPDHPFTSENQHGR